jgi:RNA polymerase sigma-70 factor (ECF subfamily)
MASVHAVAAAEEGVSGGATRTPPDAPRAALDRARGGDREAFAELYAALGDDVERLCARLLGSAADAGEAKSEVFLRAQAAFAGYDARRSFRTWLLAVAAHHCIDLLRRRGVEARVFAPTPPDEMQHASPAPGPLRAALDAESRRALLRAVESLEPRFRVPLVLRYFAELPYEAIGESLGLSKAQVASLLFRAKLLLRERLAPGEVSP